MTTDTPTGATPASVLRPRSVLLPRRDRHGRAGLDVITKITAVATLDVVDMLAVFSPDGSIFPSSTSPIRASSAERSFWQ